MTNGHTVGLFSVRR